MTELMIQKTFADIPTLHTDRMTLRRMKPSDSADMYEYAHQEPVTRYLLWDPHPSEFATREYLTRLQKRYHDGEFYDWALVLPDDGGTSEEKRKWFRFPVRREKMIGTCGFVSFSVENRSAEIGYVLNPDYWGQGYMPEAVRRVLSFGFCELGLNRIEARYMVGNEKSRRVMEKVGMTFEGVRRELLYVKGAYRDIGTCAILAAEYFRGEPSGKQA